MKKILLIEDDLSTLEVVQLILTRRGFKIQAWIREKDPVAHVKECLPDLLIIDVQLSGLDGRSICRQIKADPQIQHIPIILFSAMYNLREESLICGVEDYLVKPFELEELVNKAQKLTCINESLHKS